MKWAEIGWKRVKIFFLNKYLLRLVYIICLLYDANDNKKQGSKISTKLALYSFSLQIN